jgi:serine/threonine-protein kinase HipA
LSPAYDITPAPARPGVGMDFRLAMAVGDQGRQASLENALTRAPRFGISRSEAETTIDLMNAFVGEWREHFEECGVTGRDIDLLSHSFTAR